MDNQLYISSDLETIPSYEVAEMMDKPHKDVLAMIHGNSQRRGIIQVLTEIQMYPSEYFIESTYVDGSGKENIYYECTRMGCDMLANKMTGDKGIIFSAKYVKVFNDMRQALIANSLPVPQSPSLIGNNPYHNRLIRKNINQLDTDAVPKYVNQVVEQAKDYKPADRLNTYELTRAALEDLLPTLTDSFDIEMVQAPLRKLNKLIENQKMYISRSKLGSSTKRINNLEQQLDEWIQYTEQLEQQLDNLQPEERQWTTLPIHPFSENYQYDKSYRITPAYRYWRNNFPRHLVPTKEEYESYQDIDFTQPICIEFKLVHMDKFDTANLIKSLLDMLFNDILGVDDNIVTKIIPETVGYCDSYDEGQISFCIYNI